MTMTDADLREALAPLGHEGATEEEIRAVLAVATPVRERRTWRRVSLAGAAATLVAGVLLVALPSTDRSGSVSGVALLRAASATAAEQPGPPAFAGYRYTEVLSRWRYGPLRDGSHREAEQHVESWVDRNWRGREIGHRGRLIDGTLPEDRHLIEPFDRAYAYGDTPKAYVDRLPTEPARLRRALIDSMGTEQWLESPSDPVPKDEMIEYHLIRRTILVLESANTTPQLRAALWGVLAMAPRVHAAPDVRDPLGRAGEAVRIPLPSEAGHEHDLTVIFDPGTSDLLHWSIGSRSPASPAERHTILRAAHVHEIGER